MRLLFVLIVSSFLGVIGCSGPEPEIKLIPLTTTSPEAEKLMREVMLNAEEFRQDENEPILSKILTLDPDFAFAKMYAPRYFDNDPANAKAIFLSGYENREAVSPIEQQIMSAMHSGFIEGDDVKRSEILDDVIAAHPGYYQLRLMSANSYNDLANPSMVNQRLVEAAKINPESFYAYTRRAMLHFPVGAFFVNLPVEDRNLDEAKGLLDVAQDILPASPIPNRFLGNIYRNEGDLDAALAAYKATVELVDNKESRFFSEAQLMVGHALTFKGDYEEARVAYRKGFDASPDLWWKFQVGMYSAQSHLFERQYGKAVISLVEHKKISQEFGDSNELKLRFARNVEEAKFRALSHSLDEQGARAAIDEFTVLSTKIAEIEQARAESAEERSRIKRQVDQRIASLNIWFDILFAKFDDARTRLSSFKAMAETALATNPNALVPYFKLRAHLHLMEGNPEQAIEVYSNVPQTLLDDDVYHTYFFALAKKAVGELDESRQILEYISGYYFYDWGSALVRNLVEDQLASW